MRRLLYLVLATLILAAAVAGLMRGRQDALAVSQTNKARAAELQSRALRLKKEAELSSTDRIRRDALLKEARSLSREGQEITNERRRPVIQKFFDLFR